MTDLRHADQTSLFHPFTSVANQMQDGSLFMVRGEGAYIVDINGRRYLDGSAGLWCVNVGHGRSEIGEAIREQGELISFAHSFAGFANEPSVRLAERVLSLAPDNMARVFFGLTGSDGNETNIKIASYYNNLRGFPKKKKILVRRRGYHGSTFLTASMTGFEHVHRNFDVDFPLIRWLSPPDYLNSSARKKGKSLAEYTDILVEELVRTIENEGPDTIGVFIGEPVMAAGGVLPPPPGYWKAVSEVLKFYDILFLSDEVVTAFGRLGTWFGTEPFEVVPDLITTAKGITSAYLPLSASLIGQSVWDLIEANSNSAGAFGHGFTYSAHPLCATAAMANLDILEKEQMLPRVQSLAPVLADAFSRHLSDHPLVAETRTCGLLAAVEFVTDKSSGQHFADNRKIASRVAQAAADRDLIVRPLAPGDAIACSPPFVIDASEIDWMAQTLRLALDVVADQLTD